MSIEIDAAQAHANDLAAIADEYPSQKWFESEFSLAEGEGYDMAYVGASLDNTAEQAAITADAMSADMDAAEIEMEL